MVQINFALKEVNCKIVYYGPGMSGKTTNLEVVHKKAPTANKGDLTSIATEGDRTLFFDFMPLDLGNIAGMRTKFQLYTVPGQVYYNSTRKLVLQGVDGIIFVADSQEGKLDENLESLENLRNNLAEYGKELDEVPMVIQYNKRDLPNPMDIEQMDQVINPRGLPKFEAVATTGEGVFPTLKALSAMVLENLSKERRGQAAPARQPAAAPAAAAASSAPPAAPRPAPRPAAPAPKPEEQRVAARAPSTPAPPKPAPRPAEAPQPAPPPPAAPQQPAPPRPAAPQAPTSPKPAGPAPVPSRPAAGGGAPGGGGVPERTPPRPMAPPTQPPLVQKFSIDDERGSPVLVIALAAIILLAVGVILYSFKIV